MLKIINEENNVVCNPLTVEVSATDRSTIYIIDAMNKVANGLRAVMASSYGTTLGINVSTSFSDFPNLAADIESYETGKSSPCLDGDDWMPGTNLSRMHAALEGVVHGFRTMGDAEVMERVVGKRVYDHAIKDLDKKSICTLGGLIAAMDDFRAHCLGGIVNWDVILECFDHFMDTCPLNDEPEGKATTTE